MKRASGEIFPKSEWWPLPPEYGTVGPGGLSPQGKINARVNACRMQQTPELAVHAWDFFCNYYLRAHDGYDPMFYEDWVPPADIHYSMIYWFEKYPFTAMAFPRGGGKTTTIRSYALFKVVTNWQFFVNLYVSKYDPFVVEAMDVFKQQLTHNRRLLRDWGELAPPRGQGVWRATSIRLNNGARIRCWAVDGALRGTRGHFNNADDIEKDPDEDRPSPEKIAKNKRKFLKVILPTLRYSGATDSERQASMAITGTLTHQQCLLNHILTCDDADSSDYDEQFLSVDNGGFWMKANYGNVYDAEGHSVWQEMWSDDDLAAKARMMGYSNWSSEYGGEPISPEKPLFEMEPDTHEYWLENEDEFVTLSPFQSQARVHWNLCTGNRTLVTTPQTELWAEKVSAMTRVITVDVASGLEAHHDYSVIHVMGLDHNNDLWSLDLWQDRVTDAVLIDKIWEYAMRWQISILGIEAVGLQEQYFHAAQEKAHIMLDSVGWVPQMRPITHGHLDKGLRIKKLEWRFNYGKIKYPGDRRQQNPYDKLYFQTLAFTVDQGNLKHDDCIDTTEMAQNLLKGQRGAAPIAAAPSTPVDRLLAGETHYEGTEVPLWSGVDFHHLQPEVLEQILTVRRQMVANDDDDSEAPSEFAVVDDVSI